LEFVILSSLVIPAFVIPAGRLASSSIEEGETVLVLSRKPGTQLLLGGEIRITVLEIRGGEVKIGIEAPPSVRVVREEARAAAAPAVPAE
jgi:carbon storage regulator CsrA